MILYPIWSQKIWPTLQTFYRVYKMSASVHVYRHCILQVRYRDFTEILLTFHKSINGSSFPVNFKSGGKREKARGDLLGKKERDACYKEAPCVYVCDHWCPQIYDWQFRNEYLIDVY